MADKIIISSDSTCDLPKELCEKRSISIFPLPVLFDDDLRRDGVGITPEDVFGHYNRTGRLVKTCAPNALEYKEYFGSFVDEGNKVIHFNISSKMSTTNNVCNMAAKEIGNVYPINSGNLSTGIGYLVMEAVKLRDEGLSAEEIVSRVNERREHMDVSFIIDTLKYLHKGGRCTSVAALGANLLKLKPCIEVKDGEMNVGKKYRGNLPSVLMQYISDRLHTPEDIDTSLIFVTHAGCPADLVSEVIKKVKELVPFDYVCNAPTGCTIAIHCGPGTLGLLFARKTKRNKID